jgi:hypothetical protein
VVVRAGVEQPTHVYLLITGGNLYAQYLNQTVGAVRLEFASGNHQSVPLVAGGNLREWKLDTAATVRDNAQGIEVFSTPSRHGGIGIIDMLTIPVSPDLQSGTLERIVVEDWSQRTLGSMDPAINLLGVTVRGRG